MLFEGILKILKILKILMAKKAMLSDFEN